MLRLRDLVYSFEPSNADTVLEPWIASGGSDPSTGWTREELRAHVRDEHSTFGWILEGILQRAGFDIEEANYDESTIYADYVAIKRTDMSRDTAAALP